MSREFTYVEETDSDGNILGTTILETGGYFAGWKPKELAKIADNFTPRYSSGNLSDTFADIYFNYELRKELERCTQQSTSLSV